MKHIIFTEREGMPLTVSNFFDLQAALFFIKWAILIILLFYAIFAVIVVRQVDLMSKTLITGISPLVRAFSILHAGFSVGFIFLVYGAL